MSYSSQSLPTTWVDVVKKRGYVRVDVLVSEATLIKLR